MSLSVEEKRRIALLLGDCPRKQLHAEVPHEIRLRLPRSPIPLEQVVSDLDGLSRIGPIGGRRLAAVYLESGAAWLEPRYEALELRALAARVARGQPAVVCMNERVPADWMPLYPGAEVIQIGGPHSDWHLEAAPGAADWHAARAAIDEALATLSAHKAQHGATPVAVFASTAYALAAYVGNRVRALCEAHTAFYQPVWNRDRSETRWFDFGPAGSREVSLDPVLKARSVTGRDPRERALVVEVTHRAVDTQVGAGLEAAGCPRAVVETIGVDETGPAALTGRPVIDRAAADLIHAVYEAASRSEVEVVHLFYIGPAALLMRAAHKFHVLPRPLVVHERGPGTKFRPAIRFAEGTAVLLGS